MKLPAFVYCENKNGLAGAGLVLCTTPPYHLAKVIRFDSKSELDVFIRKYNIDTRCKIIGYNILAAYVGTLDHYSQSIINNSGLSEAVLKVLEEMAIFYEDEKIRGNETRLKRYKS